MNNYSFGNTLKTLRREKGITQLRLAELLCISPQAVSKWENDLGYPDLTLLIPLSDIFGVSIDYLLGKHANTKDEELAEAKAKVDALWRDALENNCDNDAACIAVWRALLAKYPADDTCRNQLAFQLESCDGAPTGEALARMREACTLYTAILDESRDAKARSFALGRLVWLYANKLGETELAVKLAGQAGNVTTGELLTRIEHHPARKHWLQQEVKTHTAALIWAIADQSYADEAETILALRAALTILDTVCYDRPHGYFEGRYAAYFRRRICEMRAKAGLFDETVWDDLRAMVETCRRADNYPLGTQGFGENIFLSTLSDEHTLPDCEMRFARELLDDAAFDAIRDDARFGALATMLNV